MSPKKCKFCSKDNSNESLFCIECGARLEDLKGNNASQPTGTDADSNNKTLRDQVRSLSEAVVELRSEVGRLRQDIVSLHNKRKGNSDTAVKPASSREMILDRKSESTRRTSMDQLGKLSEQMPGNWLARVGGFISLIGLGFFLAVAIDNDLIGPRGQVLIGIMFGMLLIGLGEFWQKKISNVG